MQTFPHSAVLAGLLSALAGCSSDVEFAGHDYGVPPQLNAPPIIAPAPESSALIRSPAFAPLPQCLGDLRHPTYRRDLPPQPETDRRSSAGEEGCEVENGVLYRYVTPDQLGARISPAIDLHGIGI